MLEFTDMNLLLFEVWQLNITMANLFLLVYQKQKESQKTRGGWHFLSLNIGKLSYRIVQLRRNLQLLGQWYGVLEITSLKQNIHLIHYKEGLVSWKKPFLMTNPSLMIREDILDQLNISNSRNHGQVEEHMDLPDLLTFLADSPPLF